MYSVLISLLFMFYSTGAGAHLRKTVCSIGSQAFVRLLVFFVYDRLMGQEDEVTKAATSKRLVRLQPHGEHLLTYPQAMVPITIAGDVLLALEAKGKVRRADLRLSWCHLHPHFTVPLLPG